MSSSLLAARSLPGRLALWSLLLTSPLWLACGRKEPPRPPASKVPARITDLTVQQRGMEFLLTMTYPSTTMGGLPLEEIESVEIWEVVRVVSPLSGDEVILEDEEGIESEGEQIDEALEEEPEEEAPPSLFQLPAETPEDEQMEDLVTVDPRDFRQSAQLRWTLRDTELSSAVQGGTLLVRLPIEEIPEHDEVRVFAARTLSSRRLVSPFSNLATIGLREPPTPPSSVSVISSATGVELTWQATDALSYKDRSAQFGNRYIYMVTVASSTAPLVESRIVTEHEIDYEDRFPPSAPENIVALAEEGRVRLLWELSPEDDVAGYRVFRQAPGEEYESITPELIIGSELLDRDVASGTTYLYFVTAVDGANNQSEASKTTTAQVP